MEVLTQLSWPHQCLGLRAHSLYSHSRNRRFVETSHFHSGTGLAGRLSLQRVWHWGRLAGRKAARTCCSVAAFADPSPQVVEDKASAVSQEVAKTQQRGRKPRQPAPSKGSPVDLSKPIGDAERLTDLSTAGGLKGSDVRKSRSRAEGKDGTQAQRSLKAVLGAFQKRAKTQAQHEGDLEPQEEDEESGGVEEIEDGGEGAAVRQPRKPRRRRLSEEERETRRAYIMEKLGLDEEASHILNSSIPAQITIPPLEERLDALSALGLDNYEIVLAIMRYPGILSLRRFQYYGPNIAFVRSLGIRDEDLPTIVLRFPRVLVLKMEEIEPTVVYLRSLGLTDDDIRKMVLACPIIISKDVQKVMVPRVQVFQAFGMPPDKISSMLRKVPAILALFNPSRLAANLMYLEELGMTRDEIILLTSRNPEVIGHSIKDNLEPKIEWLQSLGMTQLDAARIVVGKPKLSLVKLQTRIRDLVAYGFTLDQVIKMLLKTQGLVGFTKETLYAKLSFIENVMGQSKEEISEFPTGLCYSLEKRVIPRWNEAVAAGIQDTTNWRTLIVATRERFEIMKLKRKYVKKKTRRRKSESS